VEWAAAWAAWTIEPTGYSLAKTIHNSRARKGPAVLLLGGESAQRVDVGEILRPSHGAFVLDEQVLAKNEHGESRKLGWYFRGESLTSGNSDYSRHQIDSVRDAAQLKHLIGLKKVGRFETALSKTKLG
jgi:hypothetical protein